MDQLTPVRPERKNKDGATRNAALWATVIALPLTVLVAFLAFAGLSPDAPASEADDPNPTASQPRPQSTAPVAMPAAALTERATVVCRALLAKLPATVGDLAQRPVTAGAEQNAAYGDPAVTVACGVTMPSYPPEAELWVVDGACWHSSVGPEATVLTTVDREVPVQVTVPRAYDPPLQLVPEFSRSVVASVPSVKKLPHGCTG
ncbi:hypothetical protein GCM10027290_59990 [Micromonospora sonneratiae]|uniref:DUF3515 domain-containing protein n=1 Tax=Micromonospora sonneratiae TaxID=1184706 RepID=A0ABW3YT17_9ACTN